MLTVKHQEPEMVDKKKKPHPEKDESILSKEIFSVIEDYAIKGVEDEYIPDDKRKKTEILSDI